MPQDLVVPEFHPRPLLRNAHLMTMTLLLPRTVKGLRGQESRQFRISEEVTLVGIANWQEDRDAPLILLVHGLCGSAESGYMRGAARKAFKSGFHVLRMNMRGCGETEALSRDLYHSGLTLDLQRVIDELIAEGRDRIYLAGFSMGGNQLLKLAAEWGSSPPAEVRGMVLVSPAVDVAACATAIDERSALRAYRKNFMIYLKAGIRARDKHWPGIYDLTPLRGMRKIRDYDETYTAPAYGFADAEDYYRRSSSVSLLGDIKLPSLMVASQDDPLVPYATLDSKMGRANPFLRFVTPERGGHCAFVAKSPSPGDLDGFWAENRIVQFCRYLEDR
ncbi:MAG: YheT family hydrolase [Planctomycetota bacterium]|jgi:predicted alpha/beta-fold hydrolase